MIDQWQERELHCKWYGHSLSRVLRREPIYRPVSPDIEQPSDEPRAIPCVEIRQCLCCKLEFRSARATDRQAIQARAEAALQAAREADTDDLSRQFLALARELERLAKETK